jgi:hypothetical protein
LAGPLSSKPLGVCPFVETSYGEKARMLQTGSIVLTIWSGINFLLAALILTLVILLRRDAPIVMMVFEESEIPRLDARVVSALNTLAILYNSCAAAISLVVFFVVWSSLIYGQRWAFWVLLIAIGFVQLMSFIAFSSIGNQRWQVNVVLSALYVVGIGLVGYSIFSG